MMQVNIVRFKSRRALESFKLKLATAHGEKFFACSVIEIDRLAHVVPSKTTTLVLEDIEHSELSEVALLASLDGMISHMPNELKVTIRPIIYIAVIADKQQFDEVMSNIPDSSKRKIMAYTYHFSK